jgi:hypothetical protein
MKTALCTLKLYCTNHGGGLALSTAYRQARQQSTFQQPAII